jgi:hypothetical protein
MMTEESPSSTRLINIPVNLSGLENAFSKHKLLIYTNDLSIEKDELLHLNINVNESESKGALMIVPIPNPKNGNDFGLLDVSSGNMKQFRKELFKECDNLKPKSRGFSNNSFTLGMDNESNSLIVHDVGNYKISVAPNLVALESQVDWNSFKLPDDFENRKETLSSELYKGNWAYVVAQAQVSVKDDGFGICYLDPGYDYFPTAHEFKSDDGSLISKLTNDKVYYDVKCYNCFTNEAEITHFGEKVFETYTLKDRKIINNVFKNLSNLITMSNQGNKNTYKVLYPHKYINFWEINGKYKNGNISLTF